jgi:hypothetical protein
MNAITPIRLRTPKPRPDTAYIRFIRARRDMNLALVDWLRTQPHPSDVEDEITGSVSVLRQLPLSVSVCKQTY